MLLLEILIIEMSMPEAKALIGKYLPAFPFDRITPEIISKARRHLALKFHPDRGGSEEEMKLVNDALDTLERGGGGYGGFNSRPEPTYSYRRPQPAGYAYEEPGKRKKKPGSYPFDRAPDLDPWLWAGYSGGMPPSSDTNKNSEREGSYEWLKKQAWIISGKPKPNKRYEYTFWGFAGGPHNGGMNVNTLFVKPVRGLYSHVMRSITDAFLKWHSGGVRAVIVTKPGKIPLVIPIVDGKATSKPSWFWQSREGASGNPFNDPSFGIHVTRKLDMTPEQREEWERSNFGSTKSGKPRVGE